MYLDMSCCLRLDVGGSRLVERFLEGFVRLIEIIQLFYRVVLDKEGDENRKLASTRKDRGSIVP